MDLTPKLLTEGTDFQQVRRGYDPDEVDDFLERSPPRCRGSRSSWSRRIDGRRPRPAAGGRSGPVRTPGRHAARSRRCGAPSSWPSAPPTPPSAKPARRPTRSCRPLAAKPPSDPDQRPPGGRPLRGRGPGSPSPARCRELEQQTRGRCSATSLSSSATSSRSVPASASRSTSCQRVVDDPDAFRVERPEGLEARPAPEPEPVASAEPSPEPVEPIAAAGAAPEPEPARWTRRTEPERQLASGPTPAEVVSQRRPRPCPPADRCPATPSAAPAARPSRSCSPRCRRRSGPTPGPDRAAVHDDGVGPPTVARRHGRPADQPAEALDRSHPDRPMPEGERRGRLPRRAAQGDDRRRAARPARGPPGVVRHAR